MVEEGLAFLILSSPLSPKRGITILHTAPWERDLPDQMHGTGTTVHFWQGSQEAVSAHFEIFYLIARHRARVHVSTPGSNASGLWLGFPLELGIKSRASDMSNRPFSHIPAITNGSGGAHKYQTG